ncbi:MAG TPA: metalloregulator ArsR/SmtB family transcription factor [Cellulomonas sp.]
MTPDPLSQVFSALADPIRRDIVARLTSGDATVGELAAPYDVTVQAVSKHLKVLQDAGLVSRSRDAQRRPVHLEADVFDLMTMWIERHRRDAELRHRRLDDAPPADPHDRSATSDRDRTRPQGRQRTPAGSDRVFEPWDLAARAGRVARPRAAPDPERDLGRGSEPGTTLGDEARTD